MTTPDPLVDTAAVGCPRCRTPNPRHHRFCADCGEPLARACARCGESAEPGARFCGHCGAPLAPPAAAAHRYASPESYTPPHLADKIRTSRGSLVDERKQVTVLFADLTGSLELLADRDPEEARQLLDPVIAVMMEAVHRYEGTVNQVLGDGIMAIFGAPLAHENHAVRAAYAAIRMQERVGRAAAELRRTQGVDVQIRVGLNSGEVVVRSIGSDLHMDYTAVGQTTHLASRMERLARPGTTLLTGETLRLAEGYVAVHPLGPVPVRGLADPVEVYELTGSGPARYRLQAAQVRGLSPFVGRETEVHRLRQALACAQAGDGRLVALVGEPGVGKSRLVREMVDGPWMQGWRVLEGRPVAYRQTPPWWPVLDLMRGYLQIEIGDDPRSIREKIAQLLGALDPALAPTLPAFLSLADLPTEDAVWHALDAPERRRRTQEAVRSAFLAESRRQPLVLVFEDLHRIDEETQALLDGLVDRLRGARLLILATFRPEYRHQWANKREYVQLRIEPLERATTYELLDSLLGSGSDLLPLKSFLADRTDGNPLFVEESVRTLVETRVIAGERGRYRLVKPLEALQVPGTVQAVLASRIDRLTPEAKHVLQCASVIGKDFPYSVLEAVADLPEPALRAALGLVQSAELVYETTLFPELEYTFKHALTHEVAYSGLLQATRRTLHAGIATAIERLYPERIAEQVERLAHHALRGGLRDKAVGYLRQAGAKAAARSAHREAVGFFEQALEALDADLDSRDALETAIDVVFDLRTSLAALGEFSRTLDHLRRAAAHADALGDRRRLGWVSAYLTQAHYTLGDQDATIRAAQQALSIADALGDVPLRIAATFGLGQAHHALGNYPTAQRHLVDVIDIVDGELDRERWGLAGLVSVGARIWLSAALSGAGQFALAERRACEAVDLAEAANHPWSIAGARMALGYTRVSRGHLAEAIPVLEQGLRYAREMELTGWVPMLMCALGAARARMGQAADGVALLEESVARARALRILSRQSLRVAWLAEAYLLAGRLAEAKAAAAEAHRLARHHGEHAYEASALRMLAETAAREGSETLGIARQQYREALACAERLGMRPLAALCRLGLGSLARRTGDDAVAAAELAAAEAELRELDMRDWLRRCREDMRPTG